MKVCGGTDVGIGKGYNGEQADAVKSTSRVVYGCWVTDSVMVTRAGWGAKEGGGEEEGEGKQRRW